LAKIRHAASREKILNPHSVSLKGEPKTNLQRFCVAKFKNFISGAVLLTWSLTMLRLTIAQDRFFNESFASYEAIL